MFHRALKMGEDPESSLTCTSGAGFGGGWPVFYPVDEIINWIKKARENLVITKYQIRDKIKYTFSAYFRERVSCIQICKIHGGQVYFFFWIFIQNDNHLWETSICRYSIHLFHWYVISTSVLNNGCSTMNKPYLQD